MSGIWYHWRPSLTFSPENGTARQVEIDRAMRCSPILKSNSTSRSHASSCTSFELSDNPTPRRRTSTLSRQRGRAKNVAYASSQRNSGRKAKSWQGGDWPVKPKLPLIPGHEGIGIVVQAGKDVTEVNEGDRVAVPVLGYACGSCEYCV